MPRKTVFVPHSLSSNRSVPLYTLSDPSDEQEEEEDGVVAAAVEELYDESDSVAEGPPAMWSLDIKILWELWNLLYTRRYWVR